MVTLTPFTSIENKTHIAILDTSSISFIQGLSSKGVKADSILKDYELILIPEWVLIEINDAEGRAEYLQKLISMGYPIKSIAEEKYSELVEGEDTGEQIFE